MNTSAFFARISRGFIAAALFLGAVLVLHPAFASAAVTVAPGQSVRVSANLNLPKTVSGANVAFFVSTGSGTYTGLHMNSVANFVANTSTTVSATLSVPATLAVGTYTVSAGIYPSNWSAQLRWTPNVFSFVVAKPVPQVPPTISGKPLTALTTGKAYSFTPSATGASGAQLTFSIANKPAWATFNAANGALTGTAGVAGTYGNIVISVTDGKMSASLPAFTVTVTQAVASTGTAELTWTAPTQNTDGSVLTNLAGYKIYYGTSASALTQSVTIANPGLTAYTLSDLPMGNWYFAVTAYSTAGIESGLTGVITTTL